MRGLSEVVSFRVSREVKERMERLKGYVNWPEELRAYVTRRVEELEREINFREVVEELRKTGSAPKGFSVASVREDRDSG